MSLLSARRASAFIGPTGAQGVQGIAGPPGAAGGGIGGLSGDVTTSGSSGTVGATVVGLLNKALPALAAGVLQYVSGSWQLAGLALSSITAGSNNTVLVTNGSGAVAWSATVPVTAVAAGAVNTVLITNGSSAVAWSATVPAATVAPGTAGQFLLSSVTPASAWVSLAGDVVGSTATPGSIKVTQAQSGAAVCRTDGTWYGALSSGTGVGYSLGTSATAVSPFAWSALTLGYPYISSGQGISNGYALGLGAGGINLSTGTTPNLPDLHISNPATNRYICFEFGGNGGGDGCLSMSGNSANGTGNGVLTIGGLPETSSAYNKLGASGWLSYLSICIPTGASAADPSGTPANSSVLYCAKSTGKLMLLNKGTSSAIDLSIAGPISGVTISGAAASGAVPIATSSSAGAWTVPSGDWTWTSAGVATVVSAAGDFAIQGGLTVHQTTVSSSSYTVDSGAKKDITILVNNAGAVAITGSANMKTVGRRITFKDISGAAATNPITITPSSGNIEGQSTYVLATNMGAVTFEGDGTNCWKVG